MFFLSDLCLFVHLGFFSVSVCTTDYTADDIIITYIMHLSILIPGGKGAGNGWGFDREFYPHRQAFDKDFLPGCGRFAIRHNLTCDFSTKPGA